MPKHYSGTVANRINFTRHATKGLADEQVGFKIELEKKQKIYNCFIDFQKAFDITGSTVMWAVSSQLLIVLMMIIIIMQMKNISLLHINCI